MDKRKLEVKEVKFSVANYTGIGERPLVILLDQNEGMFKNQFNDIESLKKFIEGKSIYFVVDKFDNRIPGLSNWNTKEEFDWEKLEKIVKGK